MEWQAIETAPKTERILLCMRDGQVSIGKWNEAKYHAKPKPYWSSDYENCVGTRTARVNQPTHWMPLAKAPE